MAAKSRNIPKHIKDAVRKRDGNRCRICGATEYLEFDHITPYSKGAPHSVDNIQQLCRKHNLKKSNKTANCEHCGNWIPHNAKFCQSCGRTVQPPKIQMFVKPRTDKTRKILIALVAVFVLWIVGTFLLTALIFFLKHFR